MRARRLTRPPLLAGLLAAAVAVLASIGFVAVRASFRASDERTFQRRANATITRLQHEIGEVTLAARSVALASQSLPAVDDRTLAGPATLLRSVPEVTGVAVVPAASSALQATASSGDALTTLDPAAAALALDEARDTAQPAATPPLGRGRFAIIVARYRGAPPASVVARRAALDGWLVFTVRPDGLLQAALPQTPPGSLRVALVDGGMPLAGTDRPPAGDLPRRRADVAVATRTWTFVASPATAPASGAVLPWVVLASGWALALAGLAVAVAVRRAAGRAEAVADTRTRELRLIAGLGPMLQESLDVADLIPSFAVALAREFDLDQVVVLVDEGDGVVQQAFAMGSHQADGWLPAVPSADGVPAGRSVALPLQRAGRTVGQLQLRSRAALEPAAVDALRAVADLLAAALGNAQLFAREQETVRRLQDVDRLKNDFVSTVSHELRTTVTAIAGFGDVLAQHWDKLDDDRRRDFVDRITRNSATLRLLVDGMLDFSRLERSSEALRTEPMDLADLATAQVEQLAPLLDRHTVDVRCVPGTIAQVDAAAVDRILSNLLSNAAKFAPAGTTITVEVRPDGDDALLAVTDEGPGVAPEERDRVFTRFYRGDSDAARQSRGAGVGLAVVAELVERLAAGVAIEDGPRGGARFVVRFPVPATVMP